MKDVAILTKYYKNYNYGGMLQGYALHKVISNMGLSCDIVSYDVRTNVNPVYKSTFQQCKQYGLSAAVAKIKEKIIARCDFAIKELLHQRKELFDEFMKDTGADTELYNDKTLNELNNCYRIFVSGSDQIWNPNAVRNLYLQQFVSKNNVKVSYAASIGRSNFSDYEAEILIPAIKNFDYLGVREKSAGELLKKFGVNNAELTIDPTMLLSPEDWEEVASPRQVEERYALFYFFSDSLNIRNKLKSLCNEKKLIPVFIPYAKQEFNLNDGKGTEKRLLNVGPAEFVSAVKYADFVFTDSFHGAVFSIIHRKQFVVFERNRENHVSMNSRLYDLLELFGLSERLIKVDNIENVKLLDEIDFDEVDARLNMLKASSLDFLHKSLGVGNDD